MSGGALAGVVLLVFFLAGIGVGIVVVIAMSARRTRQPSEDGWPEDEDQDGHRDGSGDPPRWPG